MFHHGLEFSFHKLAKVGSTSIITAIVEVCGMLAVGFAAGRLLGFGVMDSIFLGGMLSMSSPTIIVRVIDELKLKGQKFTELVAGTLMVEDIAGIFYDGDLVGDFRKQKCFRRRSDREHFHARFLSGHVAGAGDIFSPYIPEQDYQTDERRNADDSIPWVCFGMVMLADFLGFSSALGAFLAGSLLAGTIHVERIEHLTMGVKDLFGAVYFISVGMMVNPQILSENAIPVIVIALVAIVEAIWIFQPWHASVRPDS